MNLGDDVAVAEVGLHGARLAAHVHEHDGGGVFGDEVEHPGRGARGDVVDDVRAGLEGRRRDLGLRGVHRQHCIRQGASEFRDDWNNPAQFLEGIHRRGPRAGGLSAHIDDVGAAAEHLEAAADGCSGLEMAAAVGEGIGRAVEDAHNNRPWARPELIEAARATPGISPHADPTTSLSARRFWRLMLSMSMSELSAMRS